MIAKHNVASHRAGDLGWAEHVVSEVPVVVRPLSLSVSKEDAVRLGWYGDRAKQPLAAIDYLDADGVRRVLVHNLVLVRLEDGSFASVGTLADRTGEVVTARFLAAVGSQAGEVDVAVTLSAEVAEPPPPPPPVVEPPPPPPPDSDPGDDPSTFISVIVNQE